MEMETIMEELTIRNNDGFIKLGQAIKAVGYVESGVDAKEVIQNGLVKVNGIVEKQRGKKLIGGEVVEFNGNKLIIKKSGY